MKDSDFYKSLDVFVTDDFGDVKYVIFEENTLGYIYENKPNYLSVLFSSSLNGCRFKELNGSLLLTESDFLKIRPATKNDFDKLNVYFGGYRKVK